MRSFYAIACKTDCLQILHKFCKNWISVPNITISWHFISLRCNHWKTQNSGDFHNAINSIRRSVNGRSEANDVSLLWRHSLEAVRGGLNVPVEGHLWWFLGIWTPKCCRASCGPQKGTSLRHNACFEPSCVKFHARVTSVGESGEKLKIKERPYISRISPCAPLRPIGTNFGLRVRLVDVINCAKFYHNRLRGLDYVRGRSWPFPLDFDVAVNTAWN